MKKRKRGSQKYYGPVIKQPILTAKIVGTSNQELRQRIITFAASEEFNPRPQGTSLKKGDIIPYFDEHPEAFQEALEGKLIYINGQLMPRNSIYVATSLFAAAVNEITAKTTRSQKVFWFKKAYRRIRPRKAEQGVKVPAGVTPHVEASYRNREHGIFKFSTEDSQQFNTIFGANGHISASTEASFASYINQSPDNSFSVLIKKYMKEKHITVERLAANSHLSTKTIQRMRNTPGYVPKPVTLVLVCIGLSLEPTKSSVLLRMFGYTLNNNKQEMAYQFIINTLWGCSVDEINDLMCRHGLSTLTEE